MQNFLWNAKCASDVTRGNAASPIAAGSVMTILVAALFMQPDAVDVGKASQRITISSKLKQKWIVFAKGPKKEAYKGVFSTTLNIK